MKQAAAIGAGIGPMGASEDAIGVGANFGPDGTARGQGLDPGFKHGHGHVHGHSRGLMGMGRVCIALGRTISGPLLRILGLDRFTKGKALGGMRRAGMDQNPFDMGLVKVSLLPRASELTNDASELHGFLGEWRCGLHEAV